MSIFHTTVTLSKKKKNNNNTNLSEVMVSLQLPYRYTLFFIWAWWAGRSVIHFISFYIDTFLMRYATQPDIHVLNLTIRNRYGQIISYHLLTRFTHQKLSPENTWIQMCNAMNEWMAQYYLLYKCKGNSKVEIDHGNLELSCSVGTTTTTTIFFSFLILFLWYPPWGL